MAEAAVMPPTESVDFEIETLNLEEIFDYLERETKAKQLERDERARSPTRTETPRLLDPNHPLLKRFQKALKAHLEAQISTLSDEVFELETGTKNCNAEREKKGIESYEAQQVVTRQQLMLQQAADELNKNITNRQTEEAELEKAEKMYKEQSAKLSEAINEERRLTTEVEVSNDLLNQFAKWEKEVETELKINQRISEKTKKDKLRLATEKRLQDMRIHKLQAEVWRLEADLDTMVMQLRVKEEEREKLAQAVATSNIALAANESELKCLVHGWQNVVSAINHRDKDVNGRKSVLNDLNEQMRSCIAEIETIKKLAAKEMIKNESLTIFKMRVENDLKNCMNQIHTETNKKINFEKNICKMQTMIENIEKDIKQIAMENGTRTRNLNAINREFETHTRKKVDLEHQIIKQLDDQITHDQSSKYLAKTIGQMKDQNTKKQTSLVSLENNNAQVIMEIESQKYANESALRAKNELELELKVIDKEVSDYMAVIKHCTSLSEVHLRSIEILQKRLEEASSRTGDDAASPYEQKIKQLEMSIEDVVQNISELQKFWMSEQGHVINLCHQRQGQMKDTNILKKQILILEQKNLKVEDDINDLDKKEGTINRNILSLQNKLELFQKQLDKKRQNKTGLNSENFVKSREFEIKLGELELESIQLENSLVEYEEEKSTLAKDLIEKNREVLEWEKKLKMVLEAKKVAKEEMADEGDVGKMKKEIHRMEVRYSQLKKASDQMIKDLEHCVSRRDGIVTNALAKQRRSVGGTQNTRFHHNKRLVEVKNKHKTLKTRLEAINEDITTKDARITELNEESANLQEEVDKLEKEVADMREQMEEKQTKKQLNLEVLVSKQAKLKVYSELGKGRKPYSRFKTEAAQAEAIAKEKETNEKLLSVVGSAMADLPKYAHPLRRIENTLKVPSMDPDNKEKVEGSVTPTSSKSEACTSDTCFDVPLLELGPDI